MYIGWLLLAYPVIGLLMAILSIRVWRRHDSTSFLGRLMFPWTWHENDIGKVPNTLCGLAVEGGWFWIAFYIVLMMIAWPCKAIWSVATFIYVTFIYHEG